MINSIKARTPILALILFVLAVGYTVAAKVIVVPLGGNDIDLDLIQDLKDRITALEIAAPTGRVSAFNSESCPTGWQKYINLQGRVVVGLHDGGSLGYYRGTAIIDADAQAHSHIWSLYDGTSKDWYAFTSTGSKAKLIDWNDGVGNEGSGYYLLGVNSSVISDKTYYYTDPRTHTPPYVQLLYCEKV